MADYGLIGGFAEGLKSGLSAYNQERDRQQKIAQLQEDREIKKKSAEGLLQDKLRDNVRADMAAGMKQDPNNPNGLVWDPESLPYKQKLEDIGFKRGAADQFLGKELNEKMRLGLLAGEKGLILPGVEAAQLTPEEQAKRQSEIDLKNALAKKALRPPAAKGEKAATQPQLQAAGFARRLQQAEEVFGDLGNHGYSRATTGSGMQAMLPGLLQSGDTKSNEQAERNFVNAVLRRESGAAISPNEFTSAEKQYFPRVGDTPDVIAQKKANRQQKYMELSAEGGPAMSKVGYAGIGRDTSGGGFPRQVRSGNKMATVHNAKELKEANDEGFQ